MSRTEARAVAALMAIACGSSAAAAEERDFLARVRQLTFAGRRSGEGYFSPDGKKLVFQSEREPGNPFFQIYELDLSSGDSRRISTGSGKTTCAFFQPGTGSILFASTHHDPHSAELVRAEIDLRASGKQRRYDWDFDPEMDLYVERPDGTLERRTDARGYDAEASYSPDGVWIVFTSTRSAYAEAPDVEERGRSEADPSYFAEIYRMPATGGEPTRLTHTPGYDGGPFFTPDGERIVWRHFRPEGDIADVWTMRPDGSDPRRVTDFGSMSWAPFPHPSGAYLIFTSNKMGFANFELYLVDLGGTKEPVRVTYTDGFDGLAAFSPDGKTLAWTSTRRGGAGAQILLGEWNHEHALAALADAPARVSSGSDP